MKFSPLKSSLFALAFFMSPLTTQAIFAAEPGTLILAQADENGAQNSKQSKRLDAINKFLSSGQNLSKLPDDRLQQRLKRARAFQKTPNLPSDVLAALKEREQQYLDEVSRRGAGGTENSVPDTKKAATDETQVSTGVSEFLSSVQPASSLKDADLRQQMRKAAELSKTDGLPKEDRQKLRQVVRDARSELATRKDGGAETSTQDQAQNATQVDNADPEGKAKMLLDGKDSASSLSDGDLRQRLGTMRELLASGDLSPASKKALRAQLSEERTILRNRVGQKANGDQTNNTGNSQDTTIDGSGNTVNNTNVTVNNNTTNVINKEVIRTVLADKREGRELKEAELRRRINVYANISINKSYSEAERVQWRSNLARDRAALRVRLLDNRRNRKQQLTVGVTSGKFKFDLGMKFRPGRPVPPRSVFAAEVNADELADVLSAPPRREINRKYTLDEVENEPELRDAVARIEIDTVHFGFGEGFLREEEVINLDGIAEVMEKILAVNPGEVFMVEGHTDAVGSDQVNLQLSRERAKAVKEALITYYVIPPENLKTVGFGERFLKVPTEEAEQENRRVSVARITALVGALDN